MMMKRFSLATILLLTGCSNADPIDEELKSYEEEDAKTAEETKKMDKDLNKKLKEEEKKLNEKAVGSDNKLYGAFTNFEAEEVSDSIYYQKKKKIRYFTDNYYIYQIEKGFDKNLGLNLEMDKDFLIGHANILWRMMQYKAGNLQKKILFFIAIKLTKTIMLLMPLMYLELLPGLLFLKINNS